MLHAQKWFDILVDGHFSFQSSVAGCCRVRRTVGQGRVDSSLSFMDKNAATTWYTTTPNLFHAYLPTDKILRHSWPWLASCCPTSIIPCNHLHETYFDDDSQALLNTKRRKKWYPFVGGRNFMFACRSVMSTCYSRSFDVEFSRNTETQKPWVQF
jgi:hypothetical protein